LGTAHIVKFGKNDIWKSIELIFISSGEKEEEANVLNPVGIAAYTVFAWIRHQM